MKIQLIDEIEPSAIPIHEAGHACAAFVFRREIFAIAAGDVAGWCHLDEIDSAEQARFSESAWRRRVEQEIQIHLAGATAEMLAGHDPNPESWIGDFRNIQKWLRELGLVDPLAIRIFRAKTRELLQERRTWLAVQRIAAQLHQDGRLTGDEVISICRSCRVPRI